MCHGIISREFCVCGNFTFARIFQPQKFILSIFSSHSYKVEALAVVTGRKLFHVKNLVAITSRHKFFCLLPWGPFIYHVITFRVWEKFWWPVDPAAWFSDEKLMCRANFRTWYINKPLSFGLHCCGLMLRNEIKHFSRVEEKNEKNAERKFVSETAKKIPEIRVVH